MKSLILLSFILLLSQCRTDQGDTKYYEYSIKNKSNSKIDLIPYFNGQVNYNSKISIVQDGSIALKKEVDPPYNDGLLMSSFFVTPTSGILTHVEVVFDNSKRVIYQDCTESNQCFNQPRNIYNPIYNNELKVTYIITPEDYQNAISCGGNCY
ncbi:hypothetical protein H1R16_04550 [Marnyiella aurantia]|uniref:Uncharacterized protein n=1 Tax=Marnyiella aurantia TaxID=2758037 RepID=A0A7D7QFB4_9FLAO|nr:hypothetical protein [Marnyiella aurantia]MBA5247528.1 hypothetical protein [Marnyiella aurantia]QMS99281.1 hypothetical protein H1R16_04550 [Marnyiella aurantia]